VQVAFRQRQIFAKCARMVDDTQHRAPGAMAAEAAPAPVAPAAGQIDLSDHAAANPRGRIRFDHLADEFVAGRAGEAVVSALELEIGIADAAAEQANEGEACGPVGARLVAQFDASVFKVYGQHHLFQGRAVAEPQDGVDELLQLGARIHGHGKVVVTQDASRIARL